VKFNASRLLSLLNREDIPLGIGASGALAADPEYQKFWQAWQRDHYGITPACEIKNPQVDALELLVDSINRYPKEIVLLALGPLTNLANLVNTKPDLIEKVREVITMGGSFGEDRSAEFNTRNDPEAARIVFNAGWPVRLLGLDITRQILFSEEEFRNLKGTPARELLKNQALPWIATVRREGWETEGCSLHDAAVVAALLSPQYYDFLPARVGVELSPAERRGITHVLPVEDEGESKVLVARSIQKEKVRDFIWNRL
jgi:inosine-uridine nucleoside N-ribohydrolase